MREYTLASTKDDEGAWLLSEGEVFDNRIDPNLSGAGFKVEREGTGDFVRTWGFAAGDDTVVKIRRGALVRAVAGPEHTPEEAERINSWVSTVNGDGTKVSLGQWPEATGIGTGNDPLPA